MARPKDVVLRFITSQKSAQASILLNGWQLLAPSGEDLVCVSLMTNVPDKSISRSVKRVVKSYCQLDRSQGSTSVATHTRHCFQDVLADFVGYSLQLV
jgi:hypothetical protein